jgi:hypothetical protein
MVVRRRGRRLERVCVCIRLVGANLSGRVSQV